VTLARRRFQLSARTPRELVVPLLTPILFALVIAPALKSALHTTAAYESFVATGTIGLLIPLNTMFAGIGVLVDRESGAQRELLAAPVSRGLLVLANLIVAARSNLSGPDRFPILVELARQPGDRVRGSGSGEPLLDRSRKGSRGDARVPSPLILPGLSVGSAGSNWGAGIEKRGPLLAVRLPL
jgi:hypothetical protein